MFGRKHLSDLLSREVVEYLKILNNSGSVKFPGKAYWAVHKQSMRIITQVPLRSEPKILQE